ncbi:GNAT family N-acetyltransferase [Streptomyces sp. NL15-2K]|uniref:GNAT family N-acetyltransferase n=1 Tax=Streptomyces sp. NL15-2K TaxID=376149 RepID=UPI000FF97894|nr:MULTISPECIES: GNAT family N-acetyltransferase [Actinomycetes]WKX10172.1 GNAT family N-acetyltransferase [Kutzneria buriramensis]GCB48335.1 GCN5-related N-acetyltransferase [Streptomyces sp. NL15-2K]
MTTSQTSLRVASLDDLDSIADLHTQARAAYYRAGGTLAAELVSPKAHSDRRGGWMRALQADNRTVLCAVREGALVGILSMGDPVDTDVDATTALQLHQIHVRPSSWGQGIGSRLHDAFVRFLRDASLTTGVLEAWERNTRAQTFHARHGWAPDGHWRPGPAAADYVRLRLDLGPSVS